jgi:hypothetical protein
MQRKHKSEQVMELNSLGYNVCCSKDKQRHSTQINQIYL